MNPSWIHICEDAWAEPHGHISTKTIFDRLYCNPFPYAHHRMVLACSLALPPAGRTGDLIEIAVEMCDQDGNSLHRFMKDDRIFIQTDAEPTHQRFTVELLNLVFEKPGDYRFTVFVNNVGIASTDLEIRQMRV